MKMCRVVPKTKR